MFKFKKMLCWVFLLSFSTSMNFVYSTVDNSKFELNSSNIGLSDLLTAIPSDQHQDEIFNKIIDCYIKIKEKFTWDGKNNYKLNNQEDTLRVESLALWEIGSWRNFMEAVDEIQIKGEKLKISNETIMRLFWNLIFEDCMFSYKGNIENSFLVSIVRVNDSFVRNEDNTVTPKFYRAALIFKFKNEWFVLDPIMALRAKTVEDGIRYLTIPLEQYTNLIENRLNDPIINIECGCLEYFISKAVLLEELNGDTILDLWRKNENLFQVDF